jgi:hypothetical protein
VTLVRVDRTYRGKPTHFYELDGERVDGVTTLIGGGVPKPALTYWSARTVAEYVAGNVEQVVDMLARGGEGPTVAFLKGVPWQKRDDAAVRGTDVHALAVDLVYGTEVEVPEHLHGYVDGYARWLDASGAVPILTEFVVASRTGCYAGTADLILEVGGVRRIAEIKTGKGVYGETALQLAAYRWAEFYLAEYTGVTYTDEHDAGVFESPLPEVDDVGWVLHVTETHTEARPVPVDARQFMAFLAAAKVARWAKGSKDLVGPAVRFDTQEGEAA